MSASRPLWRRVAAIGLFTALAGCVTLLPKDKPSSLYRFGDSLVGSPAATGKPLAVRLAPLNFTRAAASDRLLTVTGNQVAYIAAARWVSPAADLFDAAVARAFEVKGGSTRLVSRGEVANPAATLTLNVSTFEARFSHGPDAAPTVIVELSASLGGAKANGGSVQKHFEARVAAEANRVGPITQAFDQAVNQVLSDLVAWVAASA